TVIGGHPATRSAAASYRRRGLNGEGRGTRQGESQRTGRDCTSGDRLRSRWGCDLTAGFRGAIGPSGRSHLPPDEV
ncbi:MAG TPA: hypothetical protein VFF61_01590, partial [Microvirga sp.]|nr:hypothetical protein [Microvirga sp.]